MTDHGRVSRELALQRHYGMSPEHALHVQQELKTKTDWYRFCPDGSRVTGTMEQVSNPCACDGRKGK